MRKRGFIFGRYNYSNPLSSAWRGFYIFFSEIYNRVSEKIFGFNKRNKFSISKNLKKAEVQDSDQPKVMNNHSSNQDQSEQQTLNKNTKPSIPLSSYSDHGRKFITPKYHHPFPAKKISPPIVPPAKPIIKAAYSENKYHIWGHSHGDHSHFFLSQNKQPAPSGVPAAPSINRSDEGCPCCVAAVDLDELTAALSKLAQNAEGPKGDPFGGLAEFDSASHWGIFLGIAGPFALLGLTAAYRNIKGTINTKAKINAVIDHLEKDIDKQKKDLEAETSLENKKKRFEVIQRLEAFQSSLKYSKFDTNFNLIVPGIINGAASTIVLSSAIVSSPWALPVIALYAGSQTLKNGYDLWRIWNEILPEELRDGVEININVGTKKVNQITNSKRKFYAANTLGFTTFTAGAIMTTIGAFPGPHSPIVLPVGLGLLTAGAVSTGITNNIWTAKFKPRNGGLGVERKNLNQDQILAEIGERREVKKLLKTYREQHLPTKLDKRFGGSLLSALPFCQKKGAKFLHNTNQSRMLESDSTQGDQIDLIERMVNVKRLLKSTINKDEVDLLIKKISNLEPISEAEKTKFTLFSFDKSTDIFTQIFTAFKELKVDNFVLNKFIKNLIGANSDHDTSIKTKEEYCEKLKDAVGDGEFREEGDRIIQIPEILEINPDESVIFRPEVIGTNEKFKTIFMKSLEECLLFDYIDKLKYEQYGLNDFYWALSKQISKDEKAELKVADDEHDSHLEHEHPHTKEAKLTNDEGLPKTSTQTSFYSRLFNGHRGHSLNNATCRDGACGI